MRQNQNKKQFCVVYFSCYAPEGYRAYDYNDQYLEDYPSMGTILEQRYDTMEQAQSAADSLNTAAYFQEYGESNLHTDWVILENKTERRFDVAYCQENYNIFDVFEFYPTFAEAMETCKFYNENYEKVYEVVAERVRIEDESADWLI